MCPEGHIHGRLSLRPQSHAKVWGFHIITYYNIIIESNRIITGNNHIYIYICHKIKHIPGVCTGFIGISEINEQMFEEFVSIFQQQAH